MTTRSIWIYITVIVFLTILVSEASAHTDLLDVKALQGLYTALNNPSQLKGWKSDGGDPCQDSWEGISCSGSSVIHIKLNGLELDGYLGFQLSDLHNLKQLDVSSNNLQGEIPYNLPLNVTHINLACNGFSQNIPYSLTSMNYLRHLNLSHNFLSGPIGNVFTGLQNLREMDLSYNNFTGDLPGSFGSLTNLSKLFLQNNEFTGSVVFLANLTLTDLNIQDNKFSGVIPSQFQYINNLWIGGNGFQIGENYPPWKFPLETTQNITSPPTTESSAIESYPSHKVAGRKKKKVGPGGIAFMVCGGTLVAICVALAAVIRLRSRAWELRGMGINTGLRNSVSLSKPRGSSAAPVEIPPMLPISSPPMVTPRQVTPFGTRTDKMPRRRSFSKKNRIPISAKLYSVAELQFATNSFSEENLLGMGSLGSVYRAEFLDGQVVAVKNLNKITLSRDEEDKFLDVIWQAARLRHPNIVTLLGYCIEHRQQLLVCEFVRNLSLDDALHRERYTPLSWILRLQIALGVARALDHLHSTCLPPVPHSNLKAANILLDEELMPHVCDCGLAVLRPLASNKYEVKASDQMANANTGYFAPEHIQRGVDLIKGDIYAFGVLLLELLTGRRPFDSLRPQEEQSLVKWASFRLHDRESLEHMVDRGIRKMISSKALSRFADIVSLCIQSEKEFRPPMSEIVEHLASLLHKVETGKSLSEDGTKLDHFERSFRSTHTRFFGSPTLSHLSV